MESVSVAKNWIKNLIEKKNVQHRSRNFEISLNVYSRIKKKKRIPNLFIFYINVQSLKGLIKCHWKWRLIE